VSLILVVQIVNENAPSGFQGEDEFDIGGSD
jgi:hypothetical protein